MNSRFDGSQRTSRSTKKRSANSLSFSMGASSMDQKQDALTVFASFVFIAIMGCEGSDRNGHHFSFVRFELCLGFYRSVVRDAFDSAVEQFQGSRRSCMVCLVESRRQ